MMIQTPFSRLSYPVQCLTVLAIAFSFSVLTVPVSAADQDNFEAYLGDTIDLHGVSYVSDQVYLFMTGPGLPANGVTLTDPTLQADQGHFTIVGVNSDQTWSMKWDTHRIWNLIDPGTYNVYVSSTPVDYSGLSGSYKVIKVYLKDPGPHNGVSVQAGTYTLKPENHISTRVETPTVVTTVTTVPTPSPEITTIPTPVPATPATTPTRKSSPVPFLAFIALTGGAITFVATRRKNS